MTWLNTEKKNPYIHKICHFKLYAILQDPSSNLHIDGVFITCIKQKYKKKETTLTRDKTHVYPFMLTM